MTRQEGREAWKRQSSTTVTDTSRRRKAKSLDLVRGVGMQCEKRITYRGHWGSREVATTFLDLGSQLTRVHAPYDLTNFLDPLCSHNSILTDDLERTMVGEGQLRRPQASYASRKLTSETAPTVMMRPFRAVLDALVKATGGKLWLPSTIPHAFSLYFYSDSGKYPGASVYVLITNAKLIKP